jgi:hypothetical protein
MPNLRDCVANEATRILATRELCRRGRLRYLLHEGQKQILDRIESSPHQVQVALCARGYGKTYLGVTLACSIAQRKKSIIKIGTEFYTDLENFILPNFEEVLKDWPDDCRPEWKSSKGKWIFKNGSEIALIGLDRKPNGLRGTHKVDLILLEEAGFISKLEAIYYSVIVPTTMHRPDCKILLLTTPPEGLDHYFWTFHDRAEQEGSLSVFTIDDNPMLNAEKISKIEKDMGGRHTTAFQREYLCKRIAEETRQLTPEFSRDKHVQEYARPPYFKYLYKTSALDSGVRDHTVQLYSVYDFPNATLHIEDELVLHGNEVITDSIYAKTKQTEEALEYSQVSRWADNDNLILLNDLNRLGTKDQSGRYWTPTAKDSVEAGVNMVRLWLKEGRLKINPRCKFLIGTLETGLWNKRRDDFERSAVYGHADALSALIYLIRNVNTRTNPIPVTFQVDLDSAFIRNPNRNNQSASVLADAFGLKRTS